MDFTKENIYSLISSFSGYEELAIKEDGVAYKLTVKGNGKSVTVSWPYELGEVFLDYTDGAEIIFQDWFECLSTDEVEDFTFYIDQVCKRFLCNETRVHEKGILFFSYELQYKANERWLNVLHP